MKHNCGRYDDLLFDIDSTARQKAREEKRDHKHETTKSRLTDIIMLCKAVEDSLSHNDVEAARNASVEMAATAMLLADKIEMKEETVK